MLLVERPGQLVSREEIRRALWDNDTFVDFDTSINLCINQIRGALDDDPRSPKYIETVPRKGYRFVAAIVEPEPELSSAKRTPPAYRPPWLLLAAAALVVAAIALAARTVVLSKLEQKPIKSLAVLPLENLSHDPEQDYFADGMTEELTTYLAKVAPLRVISHTSVAQYKGTRKSLTAIGRELGVDAVVEGGVLRSGNRVRITAQLIRVAADEHVWAESYQREVKDILALQDVLARDISAEIKIN